MPTFAVLRERGLAWNPSRSLREQDGWAEHAAFMDALVGDGFVRLGGPLGDGRRTLLIVEAESPAAIEARLADDPWTPHMLRLARVDPWEVLLAGRGYMRSIIARPKPDVETSVAPSIKRAKS